jgi:hypothetical protein
MKKLFSLAIVLATATAFAAPKCPEMEKAKRQVEATKADLEHAAHDYEGHRAKALEHVNAALQEIEQALAVKGCKP